MTANEPTADPIERLAGRLRGRLVLPGNDDYDAMRTVFLGDVDRRPAAIARVVDADDVATVVGFAAETGMELAVRAGGHSGGGYGVTEGGIVLDLRDMTGLDIDVEGRTAWAEGGVMAGAYTAATGENGLTTGFGDMGSVGVGGITLAGGIGYLVRRHGMTIDHLLAADIVTADGRLLHVDEDSHPDLFWAIRGGGGNFGVATRLRFRLVEVDQVVGGMLILPATPEVLSGVVELSDGSEELSVISGVLKAPPMPFLPEHVHGKVVVMANFVHAGPIAEGERAAADFRALAEPLVDQVGAMRYAEMFPAAEEFHPVAAGATMFVDSFDAGDAEAVVERVAANAGPMAAVQLRVLGGAMARVPEDATAFPHRRRRLMVNLSALYFDPAQAPVQEAWVAEMAGVLAAPGDQAAYVGFLGDEPADRVAAAYTPQAWARLREVKRRYDPTNLFRLNHNVPPADR